MLKPYSFLLYLLAIITFFFVGLIYAGIVDAGKNQGLAGGAIVLGYGVISAGIGLIISLFISNKTKRKSIVRLNIILAICNVGFYAYFHAKYVQKQKEKEQENLKMQQPKQQTSPVGEPTTMLYDHETKIQSKTSFGLARFTPDPSEIKELYF